MFMNIHATRQNLFFVVASPSPSLSRGLNIHTPLPPHLASIYTFSQGVGVPIHSAYLNAFMFSFCATPRLFRVYGLAASAYGYAYVYVRVHVYAYGSKT